MEEYKVNIFKGSRSLGLELLEMQEENLEQSSGIYIKSLSSGSILSSNKLVNIGDRLVAVKQYLVNGETITFDFQNKNVTEVNQILKKVKGQIELFLIRILDDKRDSNPFGMSILDVKMPEGPKDEIDPVQYYMDVCIRPDKYQFEEMKKKVMNRDSVTLQSKYFQERSGSIGSIYRKKMSTKRRRELNKNLQNNESFNR